ncbi:MAG: ParB N-terminal domain-containing protein [Candidatus Bathyarchaeia archaeon]
MMNRDHRPDKPPRFTITVLRTSDIRVHEETESKLTRMLAGKIKRDGVQRDPIVVDRDTRVVLDGTHRAAALEMLDCDKVGAWIVSYRNPSVRVSRWMRCIHGLIDIKQVAELSPNLTFTWTTLNSLDEINPDTLPSTAGIHILTRNSWTASSDHEAMEPFTLYEHIGRMEKRVKDRGCSITYNTLDDALVLLRSRQADVLLIPPILSKDSIVTLAMDGKLLPPKSTKHTFAFRPLGVNIPLTLLKSETTLQSARWKVVQLLKGKHPRFMPPGSTINGRRYEEVAWLYEE